MTKTNFSIIYKIIIIIISGFAVLHGFFYNNFKFDIETAYYFTYQSNMLVITHFILDIINILKKKETFHPRFKGAVTTSITLTFLIYHFLLSPTAEDYKGIFYIRNIILHYIVPIMTIFDYVIFDKKGNYKIVDPLIWLIIPTIYFTFMLIRAKVGGPFANGSYYPYFIVDIDKYGLKTVLRNIFFIALFFVFLGYIGYFVDRFFNKVFSKHNK